MVLCAPAAASLILKRIQWQRFRWIGEGGATHANMHASMCNTAKPSKSKNILSCVGFPDQGDFFSASKAVASAAMRREKAIAYAVNAMAS